MERQEAVSFSISSPTQNTAPLNVNFKLLALKAQTAEARREFMQEVLIALAEAKKASDSYLTPIINSMS